MEQIQGFLGKVLAQDLVLTPTVIMLGLSDTINVNSGGALLMVAMTIYRLCIASHWKDERAPLFAECQARFLVSYKLESAIYAKKG